MTNSLMFVKVWLVLNVVCRMTNLFIWLIGKLWKIIFAKVFRKLPINHLKWLCVRFVKCYAGWQSSWFYNHFTLHLTSIDAATNNACDDDRLRIAMYCVAYSILISTVH